MSHFGVTPLSTAKKLQPADSPRRNENFHQVWRRNLERLIFGEFSRIPEVVGLCRKRASDRRQKTSNRLVSRMVRNIATKL
jgi:hypothetical protein